MTRELPTVVRPIAEFLQTAHGRYLHNAVFETTKTCSVCAKPLNHAIDALCPQCQGHVRSRLPLADRVGVLIYAEEYDSQGYKVVHQYKGPNPGRDVDRVMTSLFALGLRGHVPCGRATSKSGWAVMPSSKKRLRLGEIVRGMTKRPDAEVRLSVADDFQRRQLRPANFVVASDHVPDHILLVDDSWVSGSNAQSAAAALKQAGAQDVSVFVVARVLDPSYGPTKRFLASHGRPTFDATVCPWTGSACP
ncbi:hypothetical protein [Myceligenerans pegani]|uniref:Amidophosphoribosyltransferase n=1 Tax=Myceligenerans pegani TaxID=2776917 RepID=A0ABR9MXJ8_9MICO|nr:hypothetical protein [Myceligenerans sp. TRM 65318]MBE1875497.1 hypothetical protein [Myceligenerans sp. TRM 65318]MBE3017768.1 hypothetical protein [Myceligenerans sp. TRM 65318]